MISGDLRKLLIAQIGSELTAHQLYMAISIYFDRASLRGWGKLFKDQSIEEAQHAQKIMDFLTDNEIEFDLPALKATSTRFSSPLAAAQRALQSERDVALQFERMAETSIPETMGCWIALAVGGQFHSRKVSEAKSGNSASPAPAGAGTPVKKLCA